MRASRLRRGRRALGTSNGRQPGRSRSPSASASVKGSNNGLPVPVHAKRVCRSSHVTRPRTRKPALSRNRPSLRKQERAGARRSRLPRGRDRIRIWVLAPRRVPDRGRRVRKQRISRLWIWRVRNQLLRRDFVVLETSSRSPENRGVPGSSPGLAIAKSLVNRPFSCSAAKRAKRQERADGPVAGQ
jgi:hypothetical protein